MKLNEEIMQENTDISPAMVVLSARRARVHGADVSGHLDCLGGILKGADFAGSVNICHVELIIK